MGKNLRVKDVCILGPEVVADTRHLLYYCTRRLGALVSKRHFSVILAIIFLSNVSKKISGNRHAASLCRLLLLYAWGERQKLLLYLVGLPMM